jgi:hypothetical protein
MHLRYELYNAPSKHPQKVMQELGIVYNDAIPQSVGEQWWFLDCRDIPNPLPSFLSELPASVIDNMRQHAVVNHLTREVDSLIREIEKLRKRRDSYRESVRIVRKQYEDLRDMEPEE